MTSTLSAMCPSSSLDAPVNEPSEQGVTSEDQGVDTQYQHQSTRKPYKLANSNKEKVEISQIEDYLFLSGCQPVCTEGLQTRGITCAINCIKGIKHKLDKSIQYVTIPLEDEPGARLSVYLQPVIDKIHAERQHGGRVLVYCGMGISRSASFCIGYLMFHERLCLKEAYQRVQRKRTIVCPNVGFFRQLLDFEQKLYGKKTVQILEPAPKVFVADVVWEEIREEVQDKIRDKQQQQDQLLATTRQPVG